MVGDSSRVDVGRTVADEDDSGEGEEYAEVEDMKCLRGIVWDWESRLESGTKLLL